MGRHVYIFGNPDLAIDSLPVRIMSDLQRELDGFTFERRDPHEEWEVPDGTIIIDTVVGIKEPRLFTDLSVFEDAPRMTVHDFDLIAQLRLMKKVGRLGSFTLIGLPPTISEDEATAFVRTTLIQENAV